MKNSELFGLVILLLFYWRAVVLIYYTVRNNDSYKNKTNRVKFDCFCATISLLATIILILIGIDSFIKYLDTFPQLII